jgi:hypothetical protein
MLLRRSKQLPSPRRAATQSNFTTSKAAKNEPTIPFRPTDMLSDQAAARPAPHRLKWLPVVDLVAPRTCRSPSRLDGRSSPTATSLDPYFKASVTPVKGLSVALAYNVFWLATTSDFFYQAYQAPRTTGG